VQRLSICCGVAESTKETVVDVLSKSGSVVKGLSACCAPWPAPLPVLRELRKFWTRAFVSPGAEEEEEGLWEEMCVLAYLLGVALLIAECVVCRVGMFSLLSDK